MTCPFAKQPRTRPHGRHGISLVEVTISALVVAIMAVAALRSVAVARTVDYKLSNTGRGKLLAQALMTEILQESYKDPLIVSVTLGPDVANLETSRAAYNDVDDYNGYTDSPPKKMDGTNMASDLSGWARSVKVEWISTANLTGAASLTETSCKRITVTVTYNGVTAATLVGFRTDAP